MIVWVLSNTATAAVLAVVVALCVKAFKPSAGIVHLLWLIVLLRLISPLGILFPVAIDPGIAPKVGEVKPEPAPTPVVRALPTDGPELLGAEWVMVQNDDPQPTPELPTPSVSWSPMPLLGGIWVAGGVVVLMQFARGTWRFSRQAGRSQAAPERLTATTKTLAARMNMHSPGVRVLRGLCSPMVWCFSRPVLLWPTGLEDRLSRSGQETVLVHELAHLRRRDHWVRWLEVVAMVLHWWNPLFWLVRRRLRVFSELACDRWVTSTLPQCRRAYAEALLEVSRGPVHAMSPTLAMGIDGSDYHDFERRLTNIMKQQPETRLTPRTRLALMALFLTLLPGVIPAQESPKAVDFKSVEESSPGIYRWIESGPRSTPNAEGIDAEIEAARYQLEVAKSKLASIQAEKSKLARIQAEKAAKTIEADVKERDRKVLVERILQDVRTGKACVYALKEADCAVCHHPVPEVKAPKGDAVLFLTVRYAMPKAKAESLTKLLKATVSTAAMTVANEGNSLVVYGDKSTQETVAGLVRLMGVKVADSRPVFLDPKIPDFRALHVEALGSAPIQFDFALPLGDIRLNAAPPKTTAPAK